MEKIRMQRIKKKKKRWRCKRGDDSQVGELSFATLGPVWYMCLKTENCCLKTFMEIRVGKKVY